MDISVLVNKVLLLTIYFYHKVIAIHHEGICICEILFQLFRTCSLEAIHGELPMWRGNFFSKLRPVKPPNTTPTPTTTRWNPKSLDSINVPFCWYLIRCNLHDWTCAKFWATYEVMVQRTFFPMPKLVTIYLSQYPEPGTYIFIMRFTSGAHGNCVLCRYWLSQHPIIIPAERLWMAETCLPTSVWPSYF